MNTVLWYAVHSVCNYYRFGLTLLSWQSAANDSWPMAFAEAAVLPFSLHLERWKKATQETQQAEE